MEETVKISDAQYDKIGKKIGKAVWRAVNEEWVEVGKRAVAAVAPILLAEPENGEVYLAVKEMPLVTGAKPAICAFLSSRLASLTAKPDPAVEAVREELRKQAKANGTSLDGRVDCAKLVAAVDAARGGK